MDSTQVVMLSCALIGIAYYLLFRFVFHKYLKVNLKYSILLPAVLEGLSFINYLANQNNPNGFGDLAATLMAVMVTLAVSAFTACYVAFLLVDRHKGTQ